MSDYALLQSVIVDPRGSTLTADAATSDVLLLVDSAQDFDDEGGTLQLNGVRMQYTSIVEGVDPSDPDTINLATPLAADATEDDAVSPVEGGQVPDDWYAVVTMGDDGDEVHVPLDVDQRSQWTPGDYADPIPVVVSDDMQHLQDAPGRTVTARAFTSVPRADDEIVTIGAANADPDSWFGNGVWVDLRPFTARASGVVSFEPATNIDNPDPTDFNPDIQLDLMVFDQGGPDPTGPDGGGAITVGRDATINSAPHEPFVGASDLVAGHPYWAAIVCYDPTTYAGQNINILNFMQRLLRPADTVIEGTLYEIGGDGNIVESSVKELVSTNQISENSIAAGVSALASSDRGAAFGPNATAMGSSSVAIGYNAHTRKDQLASVAIGAEAHATNGSQIAIGAGAAATDFDANIAIGGGAQAGGQTSLALGGAATAQSQNSIAIGLDAAVGPDDTQGIAIGASADVTLGGNGGAIAIGAGSSSGATSVALGYHAEANVLDGIAIGDLAKATHQQAVVIGANGESVVDFGAVVQVLELRVTWPGVEPTDNPTSLVLQSPDGTPWRLSIDNAGTISAVPA